MGHGRAADLSEQGPDPAFPGGGGGGLPHGWDRWAYPQAFYFFVFSSQDGQVTASENGLFSVTLCPKPLPKMPRLNAARLG